MFHHHLHLISIDPEVHTALGRHYPHHHHNSQPVDGLSCASFCKHPFCSALLLLYPVVQWCAVVPGCQKDLGVVVSLW